MPAVVAPTGDYFPPELKQLSATAADVLRAYVADQGRCTVCGSAWPCERAVLAEHNLAAL
jgi:hypothetical protein